MQLSDDQKARLYEAGGFLVLDDLPASSTFGVDTSAWAVSERFRGVKIVPPGLHLFMASAASSSDDPELLSAGIGGVRHALLHFVKPQEVLVRKWDENAESFERSRKRARLSSNADAETDLVGQDHLKSIDANLAPFPLDKLAKWKELTSFINENCAGRVVGFDERGDAHVDALQGATGDADGSERRIGEPATEATQSQIVDELLRYADFDLKRSWRAGATGEEVTRDARDKSRLLLEVIDRQLGGNASQLLAEMQLAFILFVYVHSFSSLEAYKRILSLICGSQSALTDSSLPLELLKNVLPSQIALLHDDAQAHELVELDAFLASQLNAVRNNLKVVKRTSDSKLKDAWSRLDRISGFELGALDADQSLPKHAVHKYDLLRNPDDSESEDEEDKPQVVMLDAEYADLEEPQVQPERTESSERAARQYWRNLDDDETDIRL